MGRCDEQLPDELQEALAIVIASNLAAIGSVLADADLPAPAYAVGIWQEGDGDDMEAAAICIGLEPDRVQAIETLSEYDAFRTTWAVSDFAISPVSPSVGRSHPGVGGGRGGARSACALHR
jgi:hypothetical protein